MCQKQDIGLVRNALRKFGQTVEGLEDDIDRIMIAVTDTRVPQVMGIAGATLMGKYAVVHVAIWPEDFTTKYRMMQRYFRESANFGVKATFIAVPSKLDQRLLGDFGLIRFDRMPPGAESMQGQAMAKLYQTVRQPIAEPRLSSAASRHMRRKGGRVTWR